MNMEPSEIGFVLLLGQFAIICFYYGFIARGRHFNWYAISGFVLLTFLLAPSVLTLWTQSQAQKRLAQVGIVFHPSIKHMVGAAHGGFWKFEATASAKDIYTFYRDNSNVSGWVLQGGEEQLHFKRDSRNLTIMVQQDWDPKLRIITFWFYNTRNQ